MPPRICIIPSSSPENDKQPKILSLPHPRTNIPTRYLLHPAKGVHELTKIPSTTSQPRSWLLTSQDDDDEGWIGTGQVIQDGALYISTPIDPLFLILPHLLPLAATKKKHQFLPVDDILESLIDAPDKPATHFAQFIQAGTAARKHLEARIRTVSDAVDVGDEKAYRVSQRQVLEVLAKKCEAMADGVLPKSLEDEFVTKPLVRPITTERESEVRMVELQVQGEESKEMEDVPPKSTVSPEITQLLRLRVASQFLGATYLPPHISALLAVHLASEHDFAALDAYIEDLKKMRAEAAAARSGDFSLKRSINDETTDERAEKKRKIDEEEKKKQNVSRGVKELSKVNTRGMAKMTSFFKRKE